MIYTELGRYRCAAMSASLRLPRTATLNPMEPEIAIGPEGDRMLGFLRIRVKSILHRLSRSGPIIFAEPSAIIGDECDYATIG